MSTTVDFVLGPTPWFQARASSDTIGISWSKHRVKNNRAKPLLWQWILLLFFLRLVLNYWGNWANKIEQGPSDQNLITTGHTHALSALTLLECQQRQPACFGKMVFAHHWHPWQTSWYRVQVNCSIKWLMIWKIPSTLLNRNSQSAGTRIHQNAACCCCNSTTGNEWSGTKNWGRTFPCEQNMT